MTRTTKADIHGIEDLINEKLRQFGYSHRVFVQWAYGQPRAFVRPVGVTYCDELSPRLPTGEMYRWLWAYYKGLCMGLMEREG